MLSHGLFLLFRDMQQSIVGQSQSQAGPPPSYHDEVRKAPPARPPPPTPIASAPASAPQTAPVAAPRSVTLLPELVEQLLNEAIPLYIEL